MRVTVLLVALLILCSACAALTAPPTISDAERCRRFGGGYSMGQCRVGAP
jgi:hypothetical protein